MKDINEVAKQLANLYGIEYVDAPVDHVVIGADGSERPLETYDFLEVFGLGRRSEVRWGGDMADLPCGFSYSDSFENTMPTATPVRYFAVDNKSRQVTIGDYPYAIAA